MFSIIFLFRTSAYRKLAATPVTESTTTQTVVTVSQTESTQTEVNRNVATTPATESAMTQTVVTLSQTESTQTISDVDPQTNEEIDLSIQESNVCGDSQLLPIDTPNDFKRFNDKLIESIDEQEELVLY